MGRSFQDVTPCGPGVPRAHLLFELAVVTGSGSPGGWLCPKNFKDGYKKKLLHEYCRSSVDL